MTLPVPVALVLSIVLGVSLARAQEREVVRDEWTARWTEGRKSSWTHEQIEHDARAAGDGIAFVRSERTVFVVDGDARLVRSVWVATDDQGRLLQLHEGEDAPWGSTTLEIARVDSGARWRRTIRELPPQEGRFDEAPFDADILSLLLLRSDEAAVTTTVPLVRGPLTLDVGPARFEVHEEADGGRKVLVDGAVREVRSANGRRAPRLVRSSLRVGRTTPERAADIDEPVPPVVDDNTGGDSVATPGVRVRTPGIEWMLVTEGREDLQLAKVDVVHPNLTWGSALIEEGRMIGATDDERLRFVTAIRRRFGDHALGDPRPCTYQGRPGFSFPIWQTVGGVELTGDLVVVDVGTARATVWVVQPTDLQGRRELDRRLAHEALELVDVERTWQRATLGDLTADVPGRWQPDGLGTFRCGSNGSWARLCRERRDGRTLEEIAERVVDGHRELEATDVEQRRWLSDLSGRMAVTLVEQSTLRMPGDVAMRFSVGVCVADVGDGLCEAVFVFAVDNELDRAEVERILGACAGAADPPAGQPCCARKKRSTMIVGAEWCP